MNGRGLDSMQTIEKKMTYATRVVSAEDAMKASQVFAWRFFFAESVFITAVSCLNGV